MDEEKGSFREERECLTANLPGEEWIVVGPDINGHVVKTGVVIKMFIVNMVMRDKCLGCKIVGSCTEIKRFIANTEFEKTEEHY